MVTARGKRKKRRRRKRKMGLGQKGELSSYGGTNWMKGELTRHSDDEDDHSLLHLLKDETSNRADTKIVYYQRSTVMGGASTKH